MLLDALLILTVLLNITAMMLAPKAIWWHLAIVAALVVALVWRTR
jgi:hypothetical protein